MNNRESLHVGNSFATIENLPPMDTDKVKIIMKVLEQNDKILQQNSELLKSLVMPVMVANVN